MFMIYIGHCEKMFIFSSEENQIQFNFYDFDCPL